MILLVLLGCGDPKLPPKLPRKLPAGVLQKIQMRRSQQRLPSDPNPVQYPRTNIVIWQYPPGASNFCWTLQTSTDMVSWVDLPGACVTDPLVVFATNGSAFFRLKGTP